MPSDRELIGSLFPNSARQQEEADSSCNHPYYKVCWHWNRDSDPLGNLFSSCVIQPWEGFIGGALSSSRLVCYIFSQWGVALHTQ